MSISISELADDVVRGIENSMVMPELKKKRFASEVLDRILVDEGIKLEQHQLEKEISKACWRQRLRTLFCFRFLGNVFSLATSVTSYFK